MNKQGSQFSIPEGVLGNNKTEIAKMFEGQGLLKVDTANETTTC